MADMAPMVQYMGRGMKMAGKAHPGFAAVARGMARKQGISKRRADAELAASTRGASAAAKRTNPRLRKV